MNGNSKAITLYYDGLCQLCSREIQHYRKQAGSEKLEFVDITDPNFNATEHELDPLKVHQVMHVRRKNGSIATEVDAFIAIWEELPRYHRLASVAKWKVIRPFLDLGYLGFAKLRPLLPRRTKPCGQSPYCEKP